MSQLTPEIPFISSLMIRSGCDMKVQMSAETNQVRAHFKGLIKAILIAPSRILENFFFISCLPAALCTWLACLMEYYLGFMLVRGDQFALVLFFECRSYSYCNCCKRMSALPPLERLLFCCTL